MYILIQAITYMYYHDDESCLTSLATLIKFSTSSNAQVVQVSGWTCASFQVSMLTFVLLSTLPILASALSKSFSILVSNFHIDPTKDCN